jgi:nucleoside-diphosphate-sugar epimerase
VPTRVANAELARRLIGFEASTRLPEGISRTIDAVGCLHNLAAPAC